ncbi:MAG: protein kinase [Polyangiaceae bacterium]
MQTSTTAAANPRGAVLLEGYTPAELVWTGTFGRLPGVADPLAETVAFDDTLGAGALPGWTEPAPARVIGDRYEVLGLLGTGGMGNVYRARDRELDELVALKVLRPEIAGNPAALERFRREVKLARRVTHPNVARVYDIGEGGGEKYLTMELFDGESLGSLVQRSGRLPIARVVELAIEVCGGLAAAHAAGVIHCDLKPDNVLLERGGRVGVTDFGIARAAAEGAAGVTGTLVGTPAYMAPEQVEGRSADARADLYALGAMLYELLTGDPPWQGESIFAVAAARLLHPPPDPRARRPDVPPELSGLVLRCMAKSPDDRFASASEIATELRSIAARLRPAAVPSIPPSDPASSDRVLPSSRPAREKQLAVLPFRNVGPKDQEHFADGLTEDLIDRLSAAAGLRVRSRGTVMRYRGGDRDPREIGRELGVTVVVEGSIRRDAGKVRVAVRLVGVADGVQIWHRRFDRPEAELFDLSDTAALAISEALSVDLAPAPRVVPGHADAIDLYLRARSSYFRFFSDQFGDSIRLFEQALARAPDDPRILAGYAMAASRLWSGGPEKADSARHAAVRAVERAPNLAESHVALAMVHYQEDRVPETVVALKRALRVSRNIAEAHDLMGRILSETLLSDAARRHLETALALEPELELTRALLGRLHLLAGDIAGAEALAESSRSITAAASPAMARLCLWTRDAARARRILDENVARDPTTWPLHRAILEVVAFGTPPFDRFPRSADVTRRFYSFLCQLEAESAVFLGDLPRALDSMEKAAQSGTFDIAWADGCPLFTPLRNDPRFLAARDTIAARAEAITAAYLAPTPAS